MVADAPSILSADSTSGVTPWSVRAVVWSYYHFGHRGDVSLFPSSNKLSIGPDLLDAYENELYPTDADGELSKSESTGREAWELNETDFKLTISEFPAHGCARALSFEDVVSND